MAGFCNCCGSQCRFCSGADITGRLLPVGCSDAEARARVLYDSMSLLREIDELGRRRSWRDRLTAIWSD